MRWSATIAVLATVVTCNEGINNDHGPGNVPPGGRCIPASGVTPVLPGPSMAGPDGKRLPLCSDAPAAVCACADYDAGYPPGVAEPTDLSVPGCHQEVALARPGCAQIAEMSGHAYHVTQPGGSDDGDIFFEICPDPDGMRVEPFGDPFAPPFTELRSRGNFSLEDALVIGRMHIEVQGCRLYLGGFQVPESAAPLAASLADGDRVSVAGDWVFDHGHSGWTEIHEARALAVVRPVSPTVSYLLLNAFFVTASRQTDLLHLDVRVPRPAALADGELSCQLVDSAQGCPLKPGVSFTRLEPAMRRGADHGFCVIELARGTATPMPYGCNPAAGCDPDQSSLDTGCNFIYFAGTIKASWKPGARRP